MKISKSDQPFLLPLQPYNEFVIYPINFETKTGFTVIRKMLRDGCISPMGAGKADELTFLTDLPAI